MSQQTDGQQQHVGTPDQQQKSELQVGPDLREIGGLAVWTVTSAKPGNGVELLRDGREDTYWQSDGSQPHLVNIQFQKKVCLSEVCLFLDFKLDESYTPNKISIRTGTGYHDLREARTLTLEQPQGWVRVPLSAPNAPPGRGIRAFFLQLCVLSNHQNGRDTHMRQIKVFGPRRDALSAMGYPIQFVSEEFATHSTIH